MYIAPSDRQLCRSPGQATNGGAAKLPWLWAPWIAICPSAARLVRGAALNPARLPSARRIRTAGTCGSSVLTGWCGQGTGQVRSGNVRLLGDLVQVRGDACHLATCAVAPEPGAALLPGVRAFERPVPHSGCVQAAQVRGEPPVPVRRG